MTPNSPPDAAPTLRIVVVAGEQSGDILGAALIEAIRLRRPDVQFIGVTGQRMRDVGCESLADVSELSVMGLVEVLRHLPRLLKLRARLRREITQWRPDLYVGVDAPDFNLGLAAKLRRAGMRAVHYVSPSIWAWRRGRAKSIGAQVDQVLCLFPFEPALYHAHSVSAEFVGHPLADKLAPAVDRVAIKRELGLDPERPLLALLPGSRRGEVGRLAEPFIGGARAFAADHPQWQVALPVANAGCAQVLERSFGADPAITRLDGRSTELLAAADMAVVASGTATLEAALVGVPMLVAYRLAPLTYWLVQRFNLLKSRWFSLPNALADRELVPELAQHEVTAEGLHQALNRLAADTDAQQRQRDGFAALRAELGGNAADRAARAVLKACERA